MNTYGMELNAVITWTDADKKHPHKGILRDTIDEPISNGHKLVIEDYEGNINEVLVARVTEVVNPDGIVLINDNSTIKFTRKNI
jgi:hypothetical protein